MKRRPRPSMAWMLAALFSAGALAEPPREVELRDDAYHYADFRDGQHDENYVEWWYFNLFDEQQQLQALESELAALYHRWEALESE